jgi:AcrR family transcriptional regulator
VAETGGVRDLLVAARREQILGAATRAFAEKGFSRSTTREVAREAGVSEGTIYNYFQDKEALLMAIMGTLNETERRADDFREALATDFQGFFEAYLRHRTDLIWENPEIFRVVMSEMLVNAGLRERYMREVVEPTMRIGEENFRERVGQEKASATDVSLAMRVVAGSVLGLLVLGILGEKEVASRWEEASDVLGKLLLHGLEKIAGDGHA